jgi:hypothetical protein
MAKPKKLRRVPLKEEYVDLTGDYKLALVLQQMIYWSDRCYDYDKFIEEEKKIANEWNQEEPNIEKTHGWVYKSSKELAEESLMRVSEKQMRRYIKALIDMELIEQRNNPKHKWDRTIQYRVNLLKLNEKLNEIGYSLSGYTTKGQDDGSKGTTCQIEKQDTAVRTEIHDGAIPESTSKITKENTTDTCTPDFKKSDDVGCNVSDAQGIEIPFFKKYKEIKNIIKNKKYEKLKNTKNKNIGDIKKFNRGQDRLGNKDPIEISAALKIYDEIDLQEHPLLVEYIKHETKLWDYSNTENVNFVRGIFIIECVYQADTFLHFCALKEKGILNIELKNIPKKAQKKKGSLLDQWRAQA